MLSGAIFEALIGTSISDVNKFYKMQSMLTIHGVPENLLDVTGTDYMVVDDY